MIRITGDIALDEQELAFSFIRSSGPGGQHVNKSSTAVQLRFDAAASPSLPDEVRRRLLRIGGAQATAQGEIVITAQRFRSQEQNRRDALDRLKALIRQAAFRPRPRLATGTPAASKKRRLELKRFRSRIKRLRKVSDADRE